MSICKREREKERVKEIHKNNGIETKKTRKDE